MRGKWAQGIVPRHFRWIIKDHIAICERPGGYGDNHRRVRRQEEIIWLRQNGFDRIISLIPGTHNLHNYEEHHLPYRHVPFRGPEDGPEGLLTVVSTIRDHAAIERIIVHREELGERVAGLVAAYLLWSELVPTGPEAISVTERLLERELGPVARELVALAEKLPAASTVPVGATIADPAAADDSDTADRDVLDGADRVDESPAST